MKKFIALITVFSLLIGIFQIPGGIYAAENPKVTLKQAIEIAKSTLNLNTEGFDFNSSYIENNNGFNVWGLSWNNSKNGENIYVSVDSDNGDIVSIGWYTDYEQPKSKIPKYSKDEALKAAEELAAKLQGERFKQTKYKEIGSQDYYSKYSNVYSFEFVRVKDGIEVPANNIYVQLDKNTLRIRSFNVVWDKEALPSKEKAFSLEKAKELFKKQLGLEVTYSFAYDNNNVPRAILTYTLKNGNSPIDALSGELLNNSYRIYYGLEKSAEAADGAVRVELTPQEQSVVEDNSKYITKEAAEQVVKQYIKIDSSMKLERANLYQGYNNSSAIWSLEWKYTGKDNLYKYISAQVDATTREFLNMYVSSSDEAVDTTKKPIDKESAKKIAEEFLSKVQPEKLKSSKFTEAKDIYGNTISILPVYQNNYSFNYVRMENGIPCPANSLTVGINKYTGEIVSYNTNWTNISFPDAANTISLEKAYEVLFNNLKFNMEYTYHYPNVNDYEKKERRLAYVLENKAVLIDAVKGQMLNYDGTPVKSVEKITYTDIKGHEAEEAIKILVDMGILVPESETYAPDSKMLQKDFVMLLVNAMQDVYYPVTAKAEDRYDMYYNQAIKNKLLAENEKNPDAVVTRQEAAKMIIRGMNYGVLAEKSNMFNASFKDASKLPQAFKGYAVIAAELGIVPAIDSYFYPSEAITKGDAAQIIVNYLKCETSL